MPKAYSYLRFSTPEQMKGDSFRRQSHLARDYASREGLELDDKLTFSDLGVSAFRRRNVDTGALGDFLQAVKAGLVEEGSYLLVESLDRISRQTARKAVRILEEICDEGITVVTLADGRAYTSETLDSDPITFLLSVLTFMRANEESATKSKRLKAAWKAKRAKAESIPMTSLIPAWLKLKRDSVRADSGSFEIIPERASIVKRIFSLYLEGQGPNSIVKVLNAERIPTWGRGEFWHRSYIFKILDSPAVIGTFVPHRMEYVDGKKTRVPLDPIPNYYPAVIDHETYSRVMELKSGKGTSMRGRKASFPLKNILSNLARCPLCGSSMAFVNKGKGWEYLVCSKARSGAGCRYISVSYQSLEESLCSSFDVLIACCPANSEEGERVQARLRELDDESLVVPELLERLLDSIQAGTLDPSPAVNERIRKMEVRMEEIQVEERRLRNALDSLSRTMVDVKLEALTEATRANPLDRARVNGAMRSLFKSVEVNFQEGCLNFEWVHSETPTSIQYGWPRQGVAE